MIGPIDVLLTFRGYAPIGPVRAASGAEEMTLFIAARSIAEPAEGLRSANGGRFEGPRSGVRKTGSDDQVPFELEPLG